MPKIKICSQECQSSKPRSRGQNLRYHVKGLVTMNTHVQYENPISSGLKVMTKVKVFQKQATNQGHGKKQWYLVKDKKQPCDI